MASLSAKLKSSLSGFHQTLSESLTPPLVANTTEPATVYWLNADGDQILDANGNPIEVN